MIDWELKCSPTRGNSRWPAAEREIELHEGHDICLYKQSTISRSSVFRCSLVLWLSVTFSCIPVTVNTQNMDSLLICSADVRISKCWEELEIDGTNSLRDEKFLQRVPEHMMLYRWVSCSRRFDEMHCLHFQGQGPTKKSAWTFPPLLPHYIKTCGKHR